jgi:hypothetical protein
VARHTTHYFLVIPRDSALGQICFTAPREPHDVSRAHVTRAVNTRISPCPLICHRSPPLLDRTSADGGAGLPRRPLISGTPSVTAQRGCQGSTQRVLSTCGLAESQVPYVFQSVAGIRGLVPDTTIGSSW